MRPAERERVPARGRTVYDHASSVLLEVIARHGVSVFVDGMQSSLSLVVPSVIGPNWLLVLMPVRRTSFGCPRTGPALKQARWTLGFFRPSLFLLTGAQRWRIFFSTYDFGVAPMN